MDKKNIEDLYPLSPMQSGMLFHSVTAGGSAVYVEQLSFRMHGHLDRQAFKQAWQLLIDRHAVLRTSFIYQDLKEPVQLVHRSLTVPFELLDWTGWEEKQQTLALEQLLENERQRSFDLTRPPLMRFALIELAAGSTHFIWTYHHILLDGWSLPVIFQELMAAYDAFRGGREPLLPAVHQYREYIRWLRRQDLQEAELFWRNTLRGFFAPTSLLYSKNPETLDPELPERFDEDELWLDAAFTERLKRFTRQNGLTVSTLINAAWALLLSRYSGESDVLFGITVSGRPPDISGADEMVGLFINTLPQRVQITPEQKSLEWLKELQAHQAAMRQFEYSPLIDIQRWSDVPRRLPMFETILVFENYPTRENLVENVMSDRDADLKMDHIRSVEQTNFPLICVSGIADQLLLKLGYNARLFEANAIQAMLGHLANLVVSLVEGPQTAIGELNMLSPAERRLVLTDWNQTQASFPDQVCVHQLFERWVCQSPDAIVLEEGETRIRFEELNRRVNQLAQRLRRMGVGPEDLVGLCFDRSINMIVSMLAVLKAGAAYLPLDPNLPQARMDFMLEDAQVKCVLTISRFSGLIQSVCTSVLNLDEINDNFMEEMVEKPDVEVRPENLAYVIYTSGSTGLPKGVQVEHRGLCNLVHYNHRWLEMGPGSRTMQYLSFIFDGSVGEIFSALTSGGTLVLAPVGLLPGPELVQWLDEEEITHAFLTPSMMVSMPYNRLPALHSIQTGGEVLTADIVRVWAPGRIFTNGYGPTEATVASSVHFVNEQDYDGANIPIGRPLANTHVYLLDANLQPVPVGLTGELYTGGVHLARGYLNRPGLTAERFVANPFYPQDPDAPQRLYRTGDLARYRPDGEIEYLGRIDHQVKIRGFRIELGEIEAILHEQPGIAQTAVIVQTAASGDRRLAAFYTLKTDHEEDVDVLQLREELRKKLPPYMIPTTFTLLEQMPYTASGKVDRKALETRSANPDRPGEHILVRPRDILEAWLVEIWEDLLGVAYVGVQDDFFELGGHSLLAVRLLGQIEQRFGQRIDISKLYIEPTVEHLAGILREKPQISSDVLEQLIVPMQSKGDLPPIFFIHPSGGTVHFYADLARAMGRDRPFYGIEAQGLNRELPLQNCVEDMASLYIQAVRTVQPEGPYRLASWSMGVVIAYEMACQLRESGQDVSLLALFDQGPVLPAAEPVDDAAYLVSVFGKDLPLVEADLRRLTAEEQIQFVWAAARKAHFIFPNITLDQFEHFVRILRTQTEAWRHYHPRPYSGKVTLFRAERQPEDGPVARDMGWGGLATQVDVIDVPGDHLTMIHLPHVKPLSQKLRQCLQYADQREISTQNMERV